MGELRAVCSFPPDINDDIDDNDDDVDEYLSSFTKAFVSFHVGHHVTQRSNSDPNKKKKHTHTEKNLIKPCLARLSKYNKG